MINAESKLMTSATEDIDIPALESLDKGENEEDDLNPDTKSDLSKFTKRYSPSGRKNIANELREIRFRHFNKKKENPEHQNSVNEKKQEIESLEREYAEVEAEITKLELEVSQEKSKLLNRVASLFRRTKIEQELKIDPKKKKLEEIKNEIKERLKSVEELEGIISDTSLLDDAKEKLGVFYGEQTDIKSKFESEEEVRDLESQSKKNGYIFMHGIPTKNRGMQNTATNNPGLKVEALSPEDKLALLIGLEPTISASVIKYGQEGAKTYYTFGVILGGGKILSAYKEDSGTIAEGLYSRRSKYDNETKDTSIQPNIESHIDKAVNDNVDSRNWGQYNELVVDRPRVAALYLNLSQLDQAHDNIEVEELKKYSEEFNLPVYALKDGKLYAFDISKMEIVKKEGINLDDGSEGVIGDTDSISIDEVLNSSRDISQEEKTNLAAGVIEKNPFKTNCSEDFNTYRIYKDGAESVYGGMDGYKNLLRSQELYQRKIKLGLTESDPGSAMDLIDRERVVLTQLMESMESADSNQRKIFFKRDIAKKIISIYGFAVDAKEHDDLEAFEACEKLINDFGSVRDCVDFVEKRIDETGEFKVVDTDVPIEIRQRQPAAKDRNEVKAAA